MKERDQYQDYIVRIYPEFNITKEEYLQTGKKHLSRTFTFQVTESCNLACTYCYQTNKGTRKMPFEIAKLAVDKLLSGEDGFREYINPKISPGIILEFIGGEPFLEIELIDQIVDYFRMRTIELCHPWATRFMISICSNGVLYRDPKVQKFLQKNRDILSFSVTVDGTQKLHDACRIFPDGSPSYHLAHDAALDWMSKGYYMGSKITIAPGNVQYLSESLLQMIADGYKDINANCVFEDVWKPEHATELYQQCKQFSDVFHKKYDINDFFISLLDSQYGCPSDPKENDNWCGGTGIMLAIDPDGNLFPCIRYMESSLGNNQKPIIIGNIYTGLATKPCEKECIHCLNQITRKSQSTEQCFYCPIATGCAWCSAYNYQMTGSVNKRVTYICEMHKARCLALNYFWNSYYKKTGLSQVFDLWVPEQWALPIIGKEEYKKLVALTLELGGKVNKDKMIIKE